MLSRVVAPYKQTCYLQAVSYVLSALMVLQSCSLSEEGHTLTLISHRIPVIFVANERATRP